MKRLKGTMVIELTDEVTGEVETITEENMVTNAVNNILGQNPMGVFYNAAGEYDDRVEWNGALLPICPNMIGGILLLPNILEEKADNMYLASGNLPVAYASNDVNSTSNTARGSLNQTESKALDNGYKFVWEFTPSQGNGTISAVALTSKQGGQNAFGSLVGDASPFLLIRRCDIGGLTDAQKVVLFDGVEIDFNKGILYSLNYEGSVVDIRQVRVPVFDIGLNETLDNSIYKLMKEDTITPTTFNFMDDTYNVYGTFLDGHDGYWYGFANEQNSSGSAKMLWIKIKKDDLSFTEGEWTLSNAKLMGIGFQQLDSYPEREVRGCIRGGYLYIMAYNKKGIYKINISNSTDVTLLNLGFTSKWKPLGESGTCQLYMTIVNDIIIGGDFQILADDTIVHTQGSARLGTLATPLMQYGHFLFGYGGSYGNEYRYAYLLMPYLATINNLAQPITKTVDKTMKITYTLTEETVV